MDAYAMTLAGVEYHLRVFTNLFYNYIFYFRIYRRFYYDLLGRLKYNTLLLLLCMNIITYFCTYTDDSVLYRMVANCYSVF